VSEYPRRGCLHWVAIPHEPGGKHRPALVVSIDARNRLASDVLVIPASTTDRPAPTHVRLRKGQGGLVRKFVLKCEQITTLPKHLLSPSAIGGPLPAFVMEQVEVGVLRANGVPIGSHRSSPTIRADGARPAHPYPEGLA
jgi:mRNA-degrading endonuclease toxin of MazEF toxin-antitoxin module